VKDSIFREGITFGSTKGSGLGLFLVRRSMHRFGGTVKLDPNVNNGAGFILTFPLSTREI
jgi:signal transduction histidine kinase